MWTDFDQYHGARKTDEGGVADAGLVAAHGDALEALQFADGVFDARPQAVKALWKEPAPLLGIFATRDDRRDAAVAGGLAIGGTVVALVGDGDARLDVGSDVERGFEFATVAGLAAGQVEVERPAVEIGLEVDLGRETAARATERLPLLPPLWNGPPLSSTLIGVTGECNE